MLSLTAYRVFHLFGFALLFASLGGLVVASRDGGSRKLASLSHGVALIVLLITGFGALAKIGLSNPGIWPLWLWVKVAIWLILGGVVVAIKRAPRSAGLLWWVLPLLGTAAAYLAIYKPS